MFEESTPFTETACTAVADQMHRRLKADLPIILQAEKLNSSLRTVGKHGVELRYAPLINNEIVPLYDALWEVLKEYTHTVFSDAQTKLNEEFPRAHNLELTFDDTERTIFISERPLS
jgi:hypothetical protein